MFQQLKIGAVILTKWERSSAWLWLIENCKVHHQKWNKYVQSTHVDEINNANEPYLIDEIYFTKLITCMKLTLLEMNFINENNNFNQFTNVSDEWRLMDEI